MALEEEALCGLTADRAVQMREDLLEACPDEFGAAYVCALDPSVRAAGGRHYTPSTLAQALFEQLVDGLGGPPQGLVLDPACGAGALLLPPLRSWLSSRTGTHPELTLAAVRTAIGGRDLDPIAVALGNVLLAAELLPIQAKVSPDRRRLLPALLSVADGLDARDPPAAAVVMNPPYGRVRLDHADRRRWESVLYGHANRYGLFLAAATRQVERGGAVAALVPAGWLGGSYFRRLREHLVASAPLRRIGFVSDRSGVFATGVLQETVIATFVVGGTPGETICEAIRPAAGGVEREAFGVARLPETAGLVVENHVNVLMCSDEGSVLTTEVLLVMLNSPALDMLYRCLTGSVAVSAYELAALPIPGPEMLREWASLDRRDLETVVNQSYGM